MSTPGAATTSIIDTGTNLLTNSAGNTGPAAYQGGNVGALPRTGVHEDIYLVPRDQNFMVRPYTRDMQIIQELVVELARVFLLRLPDTSADEDPILQAAAERSVERLVDATAARVISGERMARERARAAEQEPPQRAPAEPRSYGQAAQ